MGVVVEAAGRAWQDGKQYTTATDIGFEPTFRDFSAMVRVRARSGEKHRRRGAAPLENFNAKSMSSNVIF